MRVLVTGHDGYIGAILAPMLELAGHDVVGLDSHLYAGCSLGPEPSGVTSLRMDVRDVTPDLLRGFDAVVHLAAVSEGLPDELDDETTFDINHRGAVTLAAAAKTAGVRRYLFASSADVYAGGVGGTVGETAPIAPLTAYSTSKLLAEKEIRGLADGRFSPTFLRCGAVYGYSPRLRGDLTVNALVASAYLTGQIRLREGEAPWRLVVHIEDIARAFVAVLHAPLTSVHSEVFNVGRSDENYLLQDIATMAQDTVTGSALEIADRTAPMRSPVRVNCDKLARVMAGYRPLWNVRAGMQQLLDAYRDHGLTYDRWQGSDLSRGNRLQSLLAAGRLDRSLRWIPQPAAAGPTP